MTGHLLRTPSSVLRALAVSVIAGVAAHAFDERAFRIPVAVIVAIIAALILGAVFDTARRRVAALCLVLTLAGFLRYDAELASHPALTAALPSGAVEYRGIVVGQPSVGLSRSSVVADAVSASGGKAVPMRLSASLPIEAAAGDVISWRCAPERTIPEGAFSYGDWLFARGIAAACTVREPPLQIAKGRGGPVRLVHAAKDAFRERVRRLYPEPDASFLLGLLIGDRDGIPADMKDAFRDTGTTHVLAVSGYNVTQVTRLMLVAFALVGILRRRAAVAAIAAVALFVVMVGADASVVRAGVMGSLGLVAASLGRRYNGANAILVAGAIMLLANPLLLRHDIGFLLSFTSLIGLQTLAGAFASRVRFLPAAAGLRQVFSETLAATLATFPLVIYAFGAFAPVSLPANTLILPFIPVTTMLGAAAIVLSFASVPLGLLFALLGTAVLRLVRAVIAASSAAVPPVAVAAGPWVLVAGYACIGLLWYALARARPVRLRRPRLPPGMTVHVHDAQ